MSPLILLLVSTLYGPNEALMSCSEDAGRSQSVSFYGVANRALLGQGYRNLTGESRSQCCRKCLSDDKCFSVHYTGGDGKGTSTCELNGASVTRFPVDLSEKTGTYYYGPEKVGQYIPPGIVAKLKVMASGHGGPPGLTDYTYQTQTLASGDCQRGDQHLCQLWELEQAYVSGYMVTIPRGISFWYAVPDSQAVLGGSGMTHHGLPMSAPSSGLCCPGPELSPQDPLITTESYARNDHDGMASGCSALDAHPCILAELKAAYLRGYRQPNTAWLYFAMPDRDVRLFDDGCGKYIGAECYEGIVANTPRPADSTRVFCCPDLY